MYAGMLWLMLVKYVCMNVRIALCVLVLFAVLGLCAARGRVRTTEGPCDRGLQRQRTIE